LLFGKTAVKRQKEATVSMGKKKKGDFDYDAEFEPMEQEPEAGDS
jgi:hypothetical protein